MSTKEIKVYKDINGDDYNSDLKSFYRFTDIQFITLVTPKTTSLPMEIKWLMDTGVSIEAKAMRRPTETSAQTEEVEYPQGSGDFETWNVWYYQVTSANSATVATSKATNVTFSFSQNEIINEGLENEYVLWDTFGQTTVPITPTIEAPSGQVRDATNFDILQAEQARLDSTKKDKATETLAEWSFDPENGILEIRDNGGNYKFTIAQLISQIQVVGSWIITDPNTMETATFEYDSTDINGDVVSINYGDVSLQIGQENWVHGYNVSGVTIGDGKVVSIVGSQGQRPTIELATNTDNMIAHKTVGVATQEILDNGYGKVTTFGLVKGLSVGSGFTEGEIVYLGTNGDVVNVKPTEPTPVVELGVALKVAGGVIQTLFVTVDKMHVLGALSDVNTDGATDGDVLTYQSDGVWRPQASGGIPEGTYLSRQVQNGAFKESFDFRYNATTSVMELTNPSGNSLTQQFSDGDTALDVTTPITCSPTFGTDTVPQKNYFYILQSNKSVIVCSTSNYPSEEHIKIADITVLSETYTDAEGPLQNQNHNNHEKGSEDIGALQHIREKLRSLGATWESGVAGATSGSYVNDVGGTLYYTSTSGAVWQMHLQTYMAKDTQASDDMHVVNHFTTPYNEITTFNELTSYSDGSAIGNQYFNVFIYGIVNKGGEYSPIMINVPSGGYNNLTDANADIDATLDTTVPTNFRRTAFPIVRLVLRKVGATYTLENSFDLREQRFGIGGTGGTGVLDGEFIDTTFELQNVTDTTKVLKFDAGSITTGTTRTLTAQDKDYVVADKADVDTNTSAIATKAPLASPAFTGTNTGIVQVKEQNNGTELKIWSGSQSEYDLLTPDANTIYYIEV